MYVPLCLFSHKHVEITLKIVLNELHLYSFSDGWCTKIIVCLDGHIGISNWYTEISSCNVGSEILNGPSWHHILGNYKVIDIFTYRQSQNAWHCSKKNPSWLAATWSPTLPGIGEDVHRKRRFTETWQYNLNKKLTYILCYLKMCILLSIHISRFKLGY